MYGPSRLAPLREARSGSIHDGDEDATLPIGECHLPRAEIAAGWCFHSADSLAANRAEIRAENPGVRRLCRPHPATGCSAGRTAAPISLHSPLPTRKKPTRKSTVPTTKLVRDAITAAS